MKKFEVCQIIRWQKNNGKYRVWRITGIHLGILTREDAITLISLDVLPPIVYGSVVEELIVPVDLLEAADIEIL